ncbi:HAD superfamily hydrolase [Limosilactobacillus frumenti DSM 13145]|uniref:HAD superfamily hydrolase n=1 Tax=Limosilactobacillus frumenti DSM 13145 TaxID=1423746 RepID=A0A0R1PFB2_9LACO|nr:YqeG family HAD IIIA-type phosphatase [Limosilactobacillus frumenti]KRL27403.1 HAD superfamily hydrolase [Limosilactobacillus frumenti DSM 13145]MBA2913317.1 YqeG family HAD IIIA-type phosphatase [Limosilactobacillus frumenti]QFG72843.1 YqeG family HAD IIIA-type phosphatase [Limosilactobacillus frumenti]
MLEEFKPTWMVKSIYSVLPEQLKAQGIRCVFSDLDNTLIAWNNPNGTPELRQWMKSLSDAGIPLIVISNNNKRRVAKAVEPLGLPFVSRSLKPLSFGITRARKKLGLNKYEVVMVGDQLMTDMVAAHQAGVRSILVKPLIQTDKWTTQMNRFLEKRVWKLLRKEYSDLHWQEDLNDRK